MARPVGRPSIYTTELADLICYRIATSSTGTKNLCKSYDDMPDDTTIYDWRYKNEDFSRKYATAKMKQAELMAETILEFCEVPTFDDKEGIERVDPGRVALQRLKVDSIKWQASKLAPKIYGDKQIVETVTTENDQLKQELSELRAKLAEKAKSEY